MTDPAGNFFWHVPLAWDRDAGQNENELHAPSRMAVQTLAELYDAYGPRLYRYASLVLADRVAAEDAVQEVFAKLAPMLEGDPSAAITFAYLAAAVRNTCYSMLRRERVRGEAREPLIESVAPGSTEEERMVIDDALRTLPAEQREVVYLKVFEGSHVSGDRRSLRGQRQHGRQPLPVRDAGTSSRVGAGKPGMMSDQELEDLLRRYRVVDPPPELGEAIARPTSVEEPVYLLLCGPAVAATVLITWLIVQMSMLARPMDAVRDADVAFASEMLGGGEGVTDYARIVIPVRDQEPIELLPEETWQRP